MFSLFWVSHLLVPLGSYVLPAHEDFQTKLRLNPLHGVDEVPVVGGEVVSVDSNQQINGGVLAPLLEEFEDACPGGSGDSLSVHYRHHPGVRYPSSYGPATPDTEYPGVFVLDRGWRLPRLLGGSPALALQHSQGEAIGGYGQCGVQA